MSSVFGQKEDKNQSPKPKGTKSSGSIWEAGRGQPGWGLTRGGRCWILARATFCLLTMFISLMASAPFTYTTGLLSGSSEPWFS